VGAADLRVDLTLLGETAGSLGMLLHEFERASSIVDDLSDVVGDNALLDELNEFVVEWKHKRTLLVESIEAVYKMAVDSVKAYTQVDNDLAESIQAATTSSDAGGGR